MIVKVKLDIVKDNVDIRPGSLVRNIMEHIFQKE
jgi:hypothetical protein